jgi:hypothetical protein
LAKKSINFQNNVFGVIFVVPLQFCERIETYDANTLLFLFSTYYLVAVLETATPSSCAIQIFSYKKREIPQTYIRLIIMQLSMPNLQILLVCPLENLATFFKA